MKKLAALACLLMAPAISAQASEFEPYEMARSEVVPITEEGTDRRYELYIKLPEDYAENTDKRYPVIYATDGAIHMDTLSGTTEFLLPNVILVCISYQLNLGAEEAHFSRFRDYTTLPSENPEIQARYQLGQADNHFAFIRDEIIPYVEKSYRADPNERTYFGYSLGGSFGAYMPLSEPETFKNYVLGSPSFGERTAQFIDDLEASTRNAQRDIKANVFVSLGEAEEGAKDSVDDFVAVLKRRTGTGLALRDLEIIEGANHSGAFPETALRSVKWLSQLQKD
ncbi:MAG: alpha/beta hydrolase-fold protein [Pseudomonadota bacterium]